MRIVLNPQMQFGSVDISKIAFDPKSRDDIPQVLRGLQYIYANLDLREEVFKILEETIAPGKNKRTDGLAWSYGKSLSWLWCELTST